MFIDKLTDIIKLIFTKKNSMKNKIATVNYFDFLDDSKRTSFIESFGNSFSTMGFAIIENHGVTEELRQRLYEVSIGFFNLPEEIKNKYEEISNAGQRGYISKYRETAKGNNVPDLKEFYHIGQEVTDGDLIKDEYPANIWPKEIPAFEKVCLEVYETFEQTGQNLLKAIALYLDLDENYFTPKIHNGNSILRLLHLFPLTDISNVPEGAVRAAAHGDINLITLLMGVNAEGLQAQTLDGEWISVVPEENQIVINVGDMLERLTNKKLRSTQHRVINPSKEKLSHPRYSTPFFLHPRSDMSLACLESCIDEDNPKAFEDITAGDFLNERLKELGLK